MKHYSTILTIIVAISVIVAGCGERPTAADPSAQPALTAYATGGSDCLHIKSDLSEYPLWANADAQASNPDAPQTMQVEFNGVQYEGRYVYSSFFPPETYRRHRYHTGRGYFEVNAETGELVEFSIEPEQTPGPSVSSEEWKAAAMQLAARYIDVASYSVEYEEDYDFWHMVRFQRYIQGVKAADSMTVLVYPSGTIEGFSSLMLGRVDPKKIENTPAAKAKATALLSTQGEKVLSEKVDSILSEVQREHPYGGVKHEVTYKRFVLLEDGELGMLYTVKVELIEGSSHSGELIEILVR